MGNNPVEVAIINNGNGLQTIELRSDFDIGGLVLDIPVPEGVDYRLDVNNDLDLEIEVRQYPGSVHLCAYDLGGHVIRPGATNLLRIELPEGLDISSSSISISDAFGNLAPSLFKVELPLPEKFDIVGCYPNPFNSTLTIDFALPISDDVTLNIYDITGRMVKELITGNLQAGYHQVRWNGVNTDGLEVSSGVYFARLKSHVGNQGVRVAKLILLK
jgi:hypothetical protein